MPEEPVVLRINLILLRNDDGQGGFDKDNPDHLFVLQSAINWMNGSLEHNAPIRNPDCYGTNNCYPKKSGSDYEYIKDAKIRFQIGEILSFNQTEYWDNWDCQDFQDNKDNPVCPPTGLQYRCPNDEYNGNWYLNPLSQKINRDPNILPAINIFFTEDGQEYIPFIVNKECANPSGRFHIQDCSERPEQSLDKEQRVHMRSQFLKYSHLMNCKVCKDDFEGGCQFQGTPEECCSKRQMTDNIIDGLSRALMHELGHTVDFSAGHCNVCPGEGLMHASNPGKTLHSTEIQNAHQNIQNTNLARYVISEQPIVISKSDQTWSRFINLHRSYIVKDQRVLTLKNETNLLSDRSLIINSGGLIIDSSAIIHLYEGAEIVVKAGSYLKIRSGAKINAEESGRVRIECGGKLFIEDDVVINRQDVFHLNCAELNGPAIIGTEAIYSLPYQIPENMVSWTVFPENRVEYVIRGNSATLFPLPNVLGNVLVKAHVAAPFKELWSPKIAMVGVEYPTKEYIEMVGILFEFQWIQTKWHTGI
ncbi:MAG: hypothetical protein KDD32_05095 [Bacteroidetes bacterium]|nr:hypothetical protein [Bacteroidota bacterium]